VERALLEQRLREALAECDAERVSPLAAALGRLAQREREDRSAD
jgi:hypothetical protein